MVHKNLKSMGCEQPRIGVSALNPHCGESGLFGREEIDSIMPAIEDARNEQIDALGPFPGDTVFFKMNDVGIIYLFLFPGGGPRRGLDLLPETGVKCGWEI